MRTKVKNREGVKTSTHLPAQVFEAFMRLTDYMDPLNYMGTIDDLTIMAAGSDDFVKLAAIERQEILNDIKILREFLGILSQYAHLFKAATAGAKGTNTVENLTEQLALMMAPGGVPQPVAKA